MTPTTTPAQDATATPLAPATIAPAFTPLLGSVVVVRPSRGTVAVRRPGSRVATRLDAGGGTIPVGSVVDTRKGAVELVSALDDAGRTQAGTFHGGLFRSAGCAAPTAVGSARRAATRWRPSAVCAG